MRKLKGFYNREEVQELLGCGVCKAYEAMRAINDKLKKDGYTTIRGFVSKKVFHQTYAI